MKALERTRARLRPALERLASLAPWKKALLAQALFFAALALLRHQIVVDLKLSYEQALRSGISAGWMADLAVSLLPLAFAGIAAGLARLPLALTWTVSALVLWIAGAANTIYFRFFHAMLPWWTVRLHLDDIAVVKGSAGSLGRTWPLVASLALVALAALVRTQSLHRALARGKALLEKPPRDWKIPARHLATGLALLALALAVRQSPVWFRWIHVGEGHRGNVLSNHVIVSWWTDWTRSDRAARPGTERAERARKAGVVAAYRDFREERGVTPAKQRHPGEWPLVGRLESDPEHTRELRVRLGLPPEGPIHVLVLFLETTRQFELGHPRIGPWIFPELRGVLSKHAIQFTQAYASALTAGQTVRGQFSTLCSMLPTIFGPAEYVAHYTTRAQCLQSFFRDNGYRTAWINSFETTFHNKGIFESLHGMEKFYDGAYFRSKGITRRIGDWGLADGPVLLESVKLLNSLAKGTGRDKRPFFAHLLTISTHHPHSLVEDAPLPEALLAETAEHPGYQGYLSRLRYLDQSLGAFFKEFFASPAARNTLIVLLGDHSTAVPTHLPLTPAQGAELRFRIPLALVTRDMPRAERVETAVHQSDVAPTVAEIAGLSGNVTWVGSGLFSGEGRPWLYASGRLIHYRTRTRGCYTAEGPDTLHCLRVPPGKDPLYDAALPPVDENPALTQFFRDVIKANDEVIARNWVAPPSFKTEPAPPRSGQSTCLETSTPVTSTCTIGGSP